jgi:adenylate cyclase
VATALLGLKAMPAWHLVDLRSFDLLSTLAPPRPPEAGAIIVAIDDPSFAEVGRQWPWPRSLHARLVDALRAAGAAVVALDIIFAEPSTLAEDASLAAAMGSDVVLAGEESRIVTPQMEQEIRTEPLTSLIAAGARVGLASVSLDPDGTLRRVPASREGFARQALGASDQPQNLPSVPPGALIQYFGPPRTYPTVSYYQALAPNEFLPPGTLSGRVAIVGVSLQNSPTVEAGAADAFATAYTPLTRLLTSGAEVQATILDNLKHGLFIHPAPSGAETAAVLLAVLAGSAASWHRISWREFALASLLLAGTATSGWLLLRFGRIWLPPALPFLAAAAAFAGQGVRHYLRESAERRQIERAFSQYLAPSLVRRLARDPSTLRLGGERRMLTVLFTDVRGFTTLAETMQDEPERLTRVLNRLLTPLSEAVLDTAGTIDKYIGDCVMAFWNAPLPDAEHARHAVEAALAMLAAVDRLNAELLAEAAGDGGPAPRLEIGIGINTGACIVGNMGSDRRFSYSAIGDAVNLASRLEGASKLFHVPLLLGEATAALVASDFDLIELDRLAVKGRTQPVAVYTVLPRSAAWPDNSTAQESHVAFIGAYRARQWDRALTCISQCQGIAPALDPYYRVMQERIIEFRDNPPPASWNGVFQATDK